MEIMVFRTSVREQREVSRIANLLQDQNIKRWNFDLEDCDRILRVDAPDLSPSQIEHVLQGAGFECRELED
ncbi:hypothetical protein MUY27_03730 [Mucilaginibacter sp. RS28]|uniref:Uncharacterized protein n=1 Tax=Mucilaginibacter straminoryzae TaxID=2932774 RepID=A0A9X1X517_9SPHI|nr:hypothetical protein [Mucilaginibacter straminoryzae]MCJ8208804.1 hypothetical protein [Mucilaginibacter straminoryzae]